MPSSQPQSDKDLEPITLDGSEDEAEHSPNDAYDSESEGEFVDPAGPGLEALYADDLSDDSGSEDEYKDEAIAQGPDAGTYDSGAEDDVEELHEETTVAPRSAKRSAVDDLETVDPEGTSAPEKTLEDPVAAEPKDADLPVTEDVVDEEGRRVKKAKVE